LEDHEQVSGEELTVSGPRLHLRYPAPDDAAALFALGSDPDVTRFFSWGPYRELAEAQEWLATLPGRRETGTALELAIVDDAAGVIGITLLSEFSKRDRRCVVGTWLGRSHWGTGANLQVKALVARLAFERLGIERLGAYADLRNGRSQVALERVGFEREGVLRAFHRHGDEPRDVATYALLRADWPRSPLASVKARISGEPPAAFRA
jgi:[ribosomal protein S5]-alanine N-acetyltransferase